MPLLEAEDLSVTYGGLAALSEVSLNVERGTLVGLIGPNGAGKTTMIDAITGFASARGRLTFDGSSVDGLPPHVRARRGLARTFQSIELFADLSVRENLLVAAERPAWWSAFADLVHPRRASHDNGVDRALDLLGLTPLADRLPGEISLGQRKLVGLARTLAGEAKLALLDEPAAGLDTRESHELGHTLRSVVDDGVALLLVDHDMGLVLSVCDYVYVLDFGRVIAEGRPEAVRRNDAVISAYLGEQERQLQASESELTPAERTP
jgi:branched-chain amino acid transport system ATP-binding protein